MLLVYIFALLAIGEAEDGIITSPGPGNEYVRLQASGARSYNLTVPHVQIEDEGLSGVQKQYPIKKAEAINLKKTTVGSKNLDKDGVTGIPPKKSSNFQKYDVLSNRDKVDSGGIDFDDDTPLNGKKLVPAGSSQASRVNVKKGPNGQDYEYEYVYYYYDDEDDVTTTTAAPVKSRRTDVERGSSRRHETPKTEDGERKVEPKADDRSRSRYTTIERGKPAEPTTNEVLPRGGTSQRTRGRQMEIEEERLPSNTRFPSRNSPRGGSSITTLPPTIQTEVPPSRTRNSGNHNIRRPSLVDSSSFRTHSSELPSEADQEKYYTRDEIENTRESDLEEYVPDTIKPTTYSPPAPAFSTFAPKEDKLIDNMPDKAALDLYAILQQTQEENYVSPEPVYVQEPETTEPPTTTTTEITTTTTTTTTTTPAPQLPGRGRLRTVGGRPRTRPSHHTTTTTTQSPQESSGEPVKKSRFQPSRQGSFGRRGSQRSSTTQSSVEESSTTQRTRSFGGNRSSYNRNRGRQPVQNQEEGEQETTSTTTTTTAKPTRARLSVARPLRPGPKFNLRSRVTTTAQPISSTVDEVISSVSPQEEIPVEQPQTPAPAPPAPQDALSRLRNRPRLRVSPRPSHTHSTTEATPPPQAQEETEQEEAGESQPSSTEQTRPQSQFLKRRPAIRRFNLPNTQQ